MEELLTEGQKRYRKYKATYENYRKTHKDKFKCYRRYETSEDRREWHDNERFGGNKEKVLERDGYKCVICGMTNEEHLKKWNRYLSVDHIDGKGRNTEVKNNNMSNLRTLCLTCHGNEDIHRRNFRPIKVLSK